MTKSMAKLFRYSSGYQRWLFGDKEFDRTSGLDLYDFEARAYDPALGRFRQPDPLAESYHPISPYLYCAANPLANVDPTGCKVMPHKSSSAEFLLNYEEAKEYLKGTTMGQIISNVEQTDKYTAILIDGSPWNRTCFDYEHNTIYLDPNMGVYTTSVYFLTPAENLGHEFDHLQEYNECPEEVMSNREITDENYGNKEEERVISGSESKTAHELGRIKDGQQTRYDHLGVKYNVPKVSSTEDDIP